MRPFCEFWPSQVQSGYIDAWDHRWQRHVQQVVECCQNIAFFTWSGSCRKMFFNKRASWRSSTFVARRIICDHASYVGSIDQVDVACRELLLAASSAREKYNCTLKNQRKQLKQNNQTKRGRQFLTRLRNWKKKNARLQQDISWLEASADTLLTKAETKHAIKYVTEANGLHCAVKEKAEEVKIVELQLDVLLLQPRNN